MIIRDSFKAMVEEEAWRREKGIEEEEAWSSIAMRKRF
jgi:hypothetical protein